MKKGKKSGKWIVISIIILALIIAGYFVFFGPKPLLAPTDVKISVGNANPTITNLVPPAPVGLNAGTFTDVTTIHFTARDSNGASDLNDATAKATFTKSGETNRVGSCTANPPVGKTKTYDCTVRMEYYDKYGTWNVAVYVEDSKAASATDSSTFDVNLLQALDVAATIDLGTVNPGATDTISSAITITNLGNAEPPTYPVIITANDLIGVTTPSESIPIKIGGITNNFLASTNAGTACSDITLTDATAVPLTGVALPRGATGNTQSLYFCIKSIPEISVQDYSATWTLEL